MLIKNTRLDFKAPKSLPALTLLIGEQLFQMTQAADAFIKAWTEAKPETTDKNVISISSASDWQTLEQAVMNFSLFAEQQIVDARFDKKTLDQAGQAFLARYIEAPNPQCLLLLRAPLLSLQAVQKFSNHARVQVVQSVPPTANAIQQWIKQKLDTLNISFDPRIPALIHQFTEGNLLATSQVLDKLALSLDPQDVLSETMLRTQLSDQTDYDLFDLTEACLTGNSMKALQLLQQAAQTKIEPTLVLWLFTQEIRRLLQLLEPSTSTFAERAGQLKLWSSRVSWYQQAVSRLKAPVLKQAFVACKALDLRIKTGQGAQQIWQSFELLALTLCASTDTHARIF